MYDQIKIQLLNILNKFAVIQEKIKMTSVTTFESGRMKLFTNYRSLSLLPCTRDILLKRSQRNSIVNS